MHKISVDTNLPPLPEPFCNAHEDAGSYWPDTFSAGQMKAYARAAIERQSVPARLLSESAKDTIGRWLCADMDTAASNGANSVSMPDELVEIAGWLHAAPQPQPEGPMAETVEQAAQLLALPLKLEMK